MDSAPLILPANQPADRFYAGGAAIAEFRGAPFDGGRLPEDWVASTTTLHGEEQLGLSRLPDGRLLTDALQRDPEAWLGPEHLAAYGTDSMLLTKLLHAGQRLPVHVHPDDPFALRHLHRSHGKTEAWVILSPGEVFLGWRQPISLDELNDLVQRQQVATLLDLLHRFEVQAGDAILVPAGMPHAIGAGILLVEVQEPEDLSVLLEWEGFAIDGVRDGHLGLGFATALKAADLTVLSEQQLAGLVAHREHGPVLPHAADRWFRVDRVTQGDRLDAGFGVLVAIAGAGSVHWSGGRTALERGSTVVVPYAAGALQVEGGLQLLHCRPPARPAQGRSANAR